ncbi:MAG: hypothetical protein KF810_05220 [Rhizobiaceae bacterium]|nr:hypothetical protein [Rhizobiaceae bacterium]
MIERQKRKLRVVRFLSHAPAQPVRAAAKDKVILDAGDGGAISVDSALLSEMIQDGLVKVERRNVLTASTSGESQIVDVAIVEVDERKVSVAVNLAESPLALLMRRKGKSGQAFLSEAEFQAGERLRADYTQAQIMPRLGANWEASVSSRRRGGGIADLTDAALGARMRVERACQAVGPELSGLLIDVCCFLKGMEAVEMERQWPARSAKVLLKTALGILSRHYAPGQSPSQRKVVHWGATDYRPSIAEQA